MISWASNEGFAPYSYRGLASDVKPSENVPNGSDFYEMDTGAVYLFDGENGVWIQQ